MTIAMQIALLRARCVVRSCFKRAIQLLIDVGINAIAAHRHVLGLLRGLRATPSMPA